MSSDDAAICAEGVGKSYAIYEHPRDRLKQIVYPRIGRIFGRSIPDYYREFRALENISFQVRKGEAFGIIGRNGSGKSTLLQIIAGTLTPTSGNISVSGKVAALLELGSGFNPEFTGRENIYLNASLLGMSRDQIEARFDDVAAFADIGSFIEQPVKTYSSGMVVRLAFAVMANVDADILIIDEALAVGDGVFVQKCMRYIRRFVEQGTLLFVSHDTASVKSLCSSAMWLHEGRVRALSDTKDVTNQYLKFVYEQNQGESRLEAPLKTEPVPVQVEQRHDMRARFALVAGLRNDIQIFDFDTSSSGFGTGAAELVNVKLVDKNGRHLSWVVGGEAVCLEIRLKVYAEVISPIVGFVFKDRLGQSLFGENTYLYFQNRDCGINAEELIARFSFQMPTLRQGEYSIDVALAEGSQSVHIQRIWMHDVLTLSSVSSSVCNGLVGIPIDDVELECSRFSIKASESR